MANITLKDIELNGNTYTVVQPDGYYQEMTVGDAEQLVSTVGVTDRVPYLFITSGRSADIGNRATDEIVGGSLVWNQWAFSYNAVSCTVVTSDGVTTITPSSGNRYIMVYEDNENQIPVVAGHKYLQTVTIKSDGEHYAGFQNYRYLVTIKKTKSASWTELADIVNATESGRATVQLYSSSNTEYQIKENSFMLFDLTAMFGSTIADYVYSLETATTGAGVAWFRKLFPKPYYAYNANEMRHVSGVSAHRMVGFNQWDEEWEVGDINTTTGANTAGSTTIRSKNYVPVFPSTVYCFTCKSQTNLSGYAFYYDGDKNFVSSYQLYASGVDHMTITTPDNARYIRFRMSAGYGTTYKNDICINLSWSGTHNGEYEPYEVHEYALDDSLTLRGIPKLDENNNLYYDGDTYASDGTVTRRYGIVDLGTLDWTYITVSNRNYFRVVALTERKVNTPVVCSKYAYGGNVYDSAMLNAQTGIYTANNSTLIEIKDTNYTDAATFKTAMSGVMLVYELATPTTETAEPYTNPQIVNDWGTEEYVTDSIVPVGHKTFYAANLRDKLQHLPNLADSDGNFLIQQTGTDMTLVRFRIPQATGADGTYVLKATVSGGTPTYTWVLEE